MTSSHLPFPRPVQKQALNRQRNLCASCGIKLFGLGKSGMAQHRFGESVDARDFLRSSGKADYRLRCAQPASFFFLRASGLRFWGLSLPLVAKHAPKVRRKLDLLLVKF